ncbi:unnamed protein product, partial [Rotaria sp. Silwood2]
MAATRAAESPEQMSSRLVGQCTRQAASRAVEAPEEARARHDDDRARHVASRAAESPKQRSSRLAGQCTRQAASRAVEAPEEAQARRDEDRVRHAVSRADESPEQRRSRSEDQRRRQAASRAAQWTFMEGEAFRYDPTKSYDSHAQLCIGRMTDVCAQCKAYKWPGEAPGMCCSNGKDDERKQADRRCKTNPGTRGDIVVKLQQMLHPHNTYAHSFKTALERIPSDEYKVIIKADKTPVGEHARRFNEPLINEVAVVI